MITQNTARDLGERLELTGSSKDVEVRRLQAQLDGEIRSRKTFEKSCVEWAAGKERKNAELLESLEAERLRAGKAEKNCDLLRQELADAEEELEHLGEEATEIEKEMQQWRRTAAKSEAEVLEYRQLVTQYVTQTDEKLRALEAQSADRHADLSSRLQPVLQLLGYAVSCRAPEQAKRLLERAKARLFQEFPGLPLSPERLLTARAAAKLLGLSKKTLRAIPATELPYIRRGSGSRNESRRYREEALMNFLARGG